MHVTKSSKGYREQDLQNHVQWIISTPALSVCTSEAFVNLVISAENRHYIDRDRTVNR